MPTLDNVFERIEKLRAKVRAEREEISRLLAAVSDLYLKQQLQLALNILDDVEIIFLDPKSFDEDRSNAQWAKWLGASDRVLQGAIKIHEHVTAIVTKFGKNVRSFPT